MEKPSASSPSSCDDLAQPRRRDLLALRGDHRLARLAGRERLVHVLGDDPAGHALVQPVGQEQRQLDVLVGSAVLLADDHVLRDVDETPRQVARVGRAKRRVGEALAGTVRRDEVLEHRQALHEVRLDRALDDLALRIRHQPAHPGELAQLRERAAGAGVGHHVDRVQLVQVRDHRVGDRVGRLRPDVHDLLVPLGLGDQSVLVRLLDLADPLLVPGEDLLLLGRDDDVVLRDRHAGPRAVAEAEVLDRVEDDRDRVRAVVVDERRDEVAELLLRERPVEEAVILLVAAVPGPDRLVQGAVDLGVEDHASRGRDDRAARSTGTRSAAAARPASRRVRTRPPPRCGTAAAAARDPPPRRCRSPGQSRSGSTTRAPCPASASRARGPTQARGCCSPRASGSAPRPAPPPTAARAPPSGRRRSRR